MKPRFLPLVFVCAAATAAHAAPLPAPSQSDDFLYAIRQVESGDRYDNCPTGRHGEQGPYQFRYEVWRHYTRAPFYEARTRVADSVAVRHYDWLVRELSRDGRPPTVWEVAAAWNGGVRAVLSGRLTRGTRNYASRVENLVEEAADIRAAETPRLNLALSSN